MLKTSSQQLRTWNWVKDMGLCFETSAKETEKNALYLGHPQKPRDGENNRVAKRVHVSLKELVLLLRFASYGFHFINREKCSIDGSCWFPEFQLRVCKFYTECKFICIIIYDYTQSYIYIITCVYIMYLILV